LNTPAAGDWRIGCVRYLNSRPLIHGRREEVLLEHPSALARDLREGHLDAALVPVFEIFAHPGYRIVDGCGIISRGPVHSVFVAHESPMEGLQTVALDTASLSSAHLIRILLREEFGLTPEYRPITAGETPGPGKGTLLIGDQAFDGRRRWGDRYGYYDLGEAWRRLTRLPFVFAVWAIRPDVPEPEPLAAQLRGWMQEGIAAIDAIVAAEEPGFREEARRYLREHIFFQMQRDDREGLHLYGAKLAEHGLIRTRPAPLHFV
jgi:predicted solute-binding protein